MRSIAAASAFLRPSAGSDPAARGCSLGKVRQKQCDELLSGLLFELRLERSKVNAAVDDQIGIRLEVGISGKVELRSCFQRVGRKLESRSLERGPHRVGHPSDLLLQHARTQFGDGAEDPVADFQTARRDRPVQRSGFRYDFGFGPSRLPGPRRAETPPVRQPFPPTVDPVDDLGALHHRPAHGHAEVRRGHGLGDAGTDFAGVTRALGIATAVVLVVHATICWRIRRRERGMDVMSHLSHCCWSVLDLPSVLCSAFAGLDSGSKRTTRVHRRAQ